MLKTAEPKITLAEQNRAPNYFDQGRFLVLIYCWACNRNNHYGAYEAAKCLHCGWEAPKEFRKNAALGAI